MQKRRYLVLICLGVSLQVLLRLALDGYTKLAIPDPQAMSVPVWFALSSPVLASLAQVLPAFLVGLIASRSGFLLGALVGALSSVVIAALFDIQWHNDPLSLVLVVSLVIYALSAAIASSVAGGAGELVASRLPSNNSFKPKPLRGSA